VRLRDALGIALLYAGVAALSSCDRSGVVRGSGTIEMDEVDVASMVGGRVVALRVDEGDTVAVGDTLALLDRPELNAEFDQRSAQADQARALWNDLRAGPRPAEVEAARAELEAADAQARLAHHDLERIQTLRAQDMVAAAELDRAQSANDAARARRDAAAEQLRLLESGYRPQQVAAAGRAAQAAAAQTQATQTRLHELVLTAPVHGIVLLRNFDAGELASAGQAVFTLGDPEKLWIRCYLAAPLLPRVKIGSAAEVQVTGSSERFAGHVIEIAREAEFTPRAALTQEERANLVFGVKIALDPTGGTLKAGLPATAYILDHASGAGGHASP